MSDPTPEAAASRIAEIDADLAAKRSDDPGREALLNEKLKWYPFAHPSTPTTPPTGPAREVRGAARTGFRSNFRALQDPSLPEGHTDRRLIIDEMIAQANVAHAPGGRGPEINLPFDVVQNPGIAREPEPPVELGKLGALRGDAQWDIRALEDGQAAADDLGISDSFEAIAHTVQRLHHEGGRRWNAETSAKELESRYGAARAEDIKAAATELYDFLKANAHGAKWLGFVERLGLMHHPELVAASVARWKQRGKAAPHEPPASLAMSRARSRSRSLAAGRTCACGSV